MAAWFRRVQCRLFKLRIAGSDVAASSRGVADAQEKLKADSSSEGTGRERGAARGQHSEQSQASWVGRLTVGASSDNI